MEEVDDRVILGHLDKSHITVHTYPEYHPETSIATFRVDIDAVSYTHLDVYKRQYRNGSERGNFNSRRVLC